MTAPPSPSPPPPPPNPQDASAHSRPATTVKGFFKRLFSGHANDVPSLNERVVERLHKAAYDGDVEEVRLILDHVGGDKYLNAMNGQGCTPLHSAVIGGSVVCARELISLGADINQCDIKANSPVMIAVRTSNTECLQELLVAGADSNGDPDSLTSPLFVAAREGIITAVKMLLKYGAAVEGMRGGNSDHVLPHTPASIALVYKQLDCFKALLMAGADQGEHQGHLKAYCRPFSDKTMYHLAVMYNCEPEYVQLLYDHSVPYRQRDMLEQLVKLNNWEDRANWCLIQDLFSEPHPLTATCRIFIRKQLQFDDRLVDKLPLPPKIISFLNYS